MRFSVPIFRLKRQAKLLARDKKIPLHEALDQIAQQEGFRSWSLLSVAASRPMDDILAELTPGDLVLLGARPGRGKTLLALELAIKAAGKCRRGFFFALEYTEDEVLSRLASLGAEPKRLGNTFSIDTSDKICADHVIERMKLASSGDVAVIDYLQLLDQKRQNPELIVQVQALKNFARTSGVIIVLISQIDRSFAHQTGRLPQISDVRLPNPLDLSLFTKTCFLHEGELRLDAVA